MKMSLLGDFGFLLFNKISQIYGRKPKKILKIFKNKKQKQKFGHQFAFCQLRTNE
jgi:hypothetical protein